MQVLLRHSPTYDANKIESIIAQGLEQLDVRPQGRVLVKPNLTVAHKRFFPHAFTRPEFVDGLLAALRRRGPELTQISVGEKSGVPVPTRGAFAWAGYGPILRKHRARPLYFDEVPQRAIRLNHPAALRREIYVPDALGRCDFFVNAPKLKAHSIVKLTCALKNYVGLQDSVHQTIDHDYALSNKIVDLQEVIAPSFIAVDAIIAGQRSEVSAWPFPLDLIVMGTNQVAVDATCARILGLDPADVEYIRLAAERGLGPLGAGEIEIGGDVSLAEARSRAAGFRLTLERADEYLLNDAHMKVYSGAIPGGRDYCDGGCPGLLVSAIHAIEAVQPDAIRHIRPLSFIIGAYDGELHPGANERVVALGDCAQWSGEIRGQRVQIPSVYRPRETLDPRHARIRDPQYSILGVFANLLRQRGSPVTVVRGCPVMVTEGVHYVSIMGRIPNPSFHPQIGATYTYHLALRAIVRFWRRRLLNWKAWAKTQ